MQELTTEFSLRVIDFLSNLFLLAIGGILIKWIADRYERIRYSKTLRERLLDIYQEFYFSFNDLQAKWFLWAQASPSELRTDLSIYLLENSSKILVRSGVFFGKLGLYLPQKKPKEIEDEINKISDALNRIYEIAIVFYPADEVPEEIINEFTEKANTISNGLPIFYKLILDKTNSPAQFILEDP